MPDPDGEKRPMIKQAIRRAARQETEEASAKEWARKRLRDKALVRAVNRLKGATR